MVALTLALKLVGTATSYELDGRGSNTGREKDSVYSKTPHSDSATHPASYSIGTGVIYLGKAAVVLC